MKKPAKLRLRKETLRTLTEMHLTRVVAGNGAAIAFDGPSDLKHSCVAAAVVIGGQ